MGWNDTEEKEDKRIAEELNLKRNLISNFYSILCDSAPPTCQVDEQDDDHDEQVNNTTTTQIKDGVRDGTIPSAIADTGATSSVGTTRDRENHAFVPTGRRSTKAFHMPNGSVEAATDVDQLHHDVRHPAKEIHIVPGI